MGIAVLLLISYVLWFIEIIILYMLFVLFLWEGFYFGEVFEDTRLFIIFFLCVILFIFALFAKFKGYEVVCFLCLITIPIIIYIRNKNERKLQEKRLKKIKEEIDEGKNYMENKGGDSGVFLRLGYLYKEIKDYENALKNLKKARELTKENILTTVEREIKEMEFEMTEKQSNEIISFKPIYIFLIVVFIISAFLFWSTLAFALNLLFYVLISLNILMFVKKSLQGKVRYK